MAITTAIIFSLFGCVLILLGRGGPRAAGLGHGVLLPVAVMTYQVLVGYLFGVQGFYEWLHQGVTLNTGIALCALCVAAFCARPDTWLMNVFAGDEAGGSMARRLLPALLILPLVVGWLRLYGERAGIFGSEVGVALVAVADTLCLLSLVWLSAKSVSRTDRRRHRAEETLRESEERFRLLFQQAAVGIKQLDPTGRLLEVNDKLCDILGYSREELLHLALADITHPEDLAREQAKLARLLAREIPSYSIEKRCLRKDGRVIWVRATSSLPAAGSAKTPWWITVDEDITARKQAEEALRRTAEDLARSNKDLEQFASVASHDLQEPLRMVTGFVELLAKENQGKLGSNADTYIEYAVDGARRMRTLIDDLLAYSRVSTRGRQFEDTDATEALRYALANLHTAIGEAGGEVTHGPLPTVKADGTQLTQLFQNLVGNAVKFRSKEPPKIRVAARREGGDWLFSVADNGIGIAPEFQDRIFLIFQRLHTRREYPGTGIGLAICQKIVERHGGRLWVESGAGQGATFYFTLPYTSHITAFLGDIP
jgi:PAS domain S-box-containing protein